MNRQDGSLADIYLAQRRSLIGTVYNIVGYFHTAEDLVHDAYLRVSNAAAARPIRHLQPFLYQTARNLALDHMRRDKVRKRFMADETPDHQLADFAEERPSLEKTLIDQERLTTVVRALSRVSDRAKQALLLSRLDGLSYPEIADRLGVSESTIYNDIRLALAHCLDALDDGEPPEQGR